MTDFVFMVDDTSYMFITGPDVVKTVTGEDVTQQELGGADAHARKSGVAPVHRPPTTRRCSTTSGTCSLPAVEQPRGPAVLDTGDDPERSCDGSATSSPPTPNQPYDMKAVIAEVVDDGDFFEYAPQWAPQIMCGFARMAGRPVGIVGNQPMALAGVLDIESSEKAARFVRTCDAFNIPLVTFVDVPGFLPGVDQEHGGIIRHGAKLLYAYCESTVPRIQIITRKAYGGAYVVMNSKSIGADLAFAWPSAELAVMGAAGAVEIVNRREIAEADDPEAKQAELVDEYSEKFPNPYGAADRGYVDDVIDPADTRRKVIAALDMLRVQARGAPAAQARQRAAVGDHRVQAPVRPSPPSGPGSTRGCCSAPPTAPPLSVGPFLLPRGRRLRHRLGLASISTVLRDGFVLGCSPQADCSDPRGRIARSSPCRCASSEPGLVPLPPYACWYCCVPSSGPPPGSSPGSRGHSCSATTNAWARSPWSHRRWGRPSPRSRGPRRPLGGGRRVLGPRRHGGGSARRQPRQSGCPGVLLLPRVTAARTRHTAAPAAQRVLACLGLMTLGGSAVFTYGAVIGRESVASLHQVVALAFSANAVAAIPSARWTGRRGRAGAWVLACAAAAAAMGAVHLTAVFLAAITFWGFGFWMGVPGAFALLAERSRHPDERAGDAQSVMAAGRVVGPLIGGVLLDAMGPAVLGLVGGAVMALGGIGLLTVDRRAGVDAGAPSRFTTWRSPRAPPRRKRLPSWRPRGPVAERRGGARRADTPLAVLRTLVDPTDPAAPQPSVVRRRPRSSSPRWASIGPSCTRWRGPPLRRPRARPPRRSSTEPWSGPCPTPAASCWAGSRPSTTSTSGRPSAG